MAYPSTFLDLQNSVIAKGRLDPTADLAKVKDWLNQVFAQATLEAEALVSVATMTTTAGVSSYTLDASAVRIKGMYVTAGGVQYRPLEPVSLERILELRQGSGSVADPGPTLYALVGLTDLEFYPTPASAQTITTYYVRQPTPLVNNTDVPEIPEPFASKLLEYGALAEAADFKRDPILQNYQQRYDLWMGRFRAHLNRKKGGIPEQMFVYGSPSRPPHDPSTDTR